MKVKTIDQKMKQLQSELPDLQPAHFAHIKQWLISCTNEITVSKVTRNFKNFNSTAQL